jgi:uncharacterized membrane protein YgcG
MFGKKAIVRKYKYKLAPALAKRYGRSATYTKGQVDTTVDVLGLNKKHIRYAYLMYCDAAIYNANIAPNESIETMRDTVNSVATTGVFGALFYSSLYSSGEYGSGDDGGSGYGGGGDSGGGGD